jgi:hypothetical protein
MRERILQYLRQQPFQPFRLHLTNGAVYMIRHPDQMLVGPSYLIVGVPASESSGQDITDAINIALLHVVAIETFTPVAPPATN